MTRTFTRVEMFAQTTQTIDDHHVVETSQRELPDAPSTQTETREFDLKPGHVDAYIADVLLAHGYAEVQR